MLTCNPLDSKQNFHWVQNSAWNNSSQLSMSVFPLLHAMEHDADITIYCFLERSFSTHLWNAPHTSGKSSFLHRGKTWNILKSFDLRVATTRHLLLLQPKWLKRITGAPSRPEMRIDYICFFATTPPTTLAVFTDTEYSSISSNNKHKQRFRTTNNPAESKHIHGSVWEPMGQKHLKKSTPVPCKKQLEKGKTQAL